MTAAVGMISAYHEKGHEVDPTAIKAAATYICKRKRSTFGSVTRAMVLDVRRLDLYV